MRDTKIQWCDSTVNPIMGCGGCELYPAPATILDAIDHDLINAGISGWTRGTARKVFNRVLSVAWRELVATVDELGAGHVNEMNTTNIRHLRHRFGAELAESFGRKASKLAIAAIERNLSCYAAQLHANRGFNIDKPLRTYNPGYAPTFELITEFPGRLTGAAKWDDLTGTNRPEKPWLDGLPRLIFVSDMGDAFSQRGDFDFLRDEISAFQDQNGKRHLWLWLTKRPNTMQLFAQCLGGFPPNVCAMTTVTSVRHLSRIDALREVDAPVRGLSLEPLWESVAAKIDLAGIDWVIVGGESGAKSNVRPFSLEWVFELRELCRTQGVAFFVKQLGRVPLHDGKELDLANGHGGDWNEWPHDVRVREMPKYFHNYASVTPSST